MIPTPVPASECLTRSILIQSLIAFSTCQDAVAGWLVLNVCGKMVVVAPGPPSVSRRSACCQGTRSDGQSSLSLFNIVGELKFPSSNRGSPIVEYRTSTSVVEHLIASQDLLYPLRKYKSWLTALLALLACVEASNRAQALLVGP